jgi:hypothetical protein
VTPEARRAVQAWHRLQQNSGSCVSACRAIVDARLGGEGKEEIGYPILGGEQLDPSRAENISLVVARVRHGEAAIVTVRAPDWMDLTRLNKMRSPYGDLGEALHAVVLIAVDSSLRMLVVLDPYFPPHHQPVHVSRDNFAALWSGQVEFLDT